MTEAATGVAKVAELFVLKRYPSLLFPDQDVNPIHQRFPDVNGHPDPEKVLPDLFFFVLVEFENPSESLTNQRIPMKLDPEVHVPEFLSFGPLRISENQ